MKLDTEASVVNIWKWVDLKWKQEPALTNPFELPRNFQPKIQIGLNEKNLTGQVRAKFIKAMAEAIYWYKSYLTREEYEHVALQIVKKWNFLEMRTGHVSWKHNTCTFSMLGHIIDFLHSCSITAGVPCRNFERANGIPAQARWPETREGEERWCNTGETQETKPITDTSNSSCLRVTLCWR